MLQRPQPWTGKENPEDGPLGYRLHHHVVPVDLSEERPASLPPGVKGAALIGFSSDEGVRRNQGRVGATDGPAAARAVLANVPWQFGSRLKLIDAGDVECRRQDLEAAQDELARQVSIVREAGYLPIVLGGGHEMSWGHYRGLLPDGGPFPAMLNIDAHFDIRIPSHGPTSGTSFYDIARLCREEGEAFRYHCIGIQSIGNSAALFQRAEELGVTYLSAEHWHEMTPPERRQHVQDWLEETERLYFTICLDVFDIAFAPGVSAPAIAGLAPRDFLPLLRQVLGSGKVSGWDIAELNPRHDIDGRTARLAAWLIFEGLRALTGGGED